MRKYNFPALYDSLYLSLIPLQSPKLVRTYTTFIDHRLWIFEKSRIPCILVQISRPLHGPAMLSRSCHPTRPTRARASLASPHNAPKANQSLFRKSILSSIQAWKSSGTVISFNCPSKLETCCCMGFIEIIWWAPAIIWCSLSARNLAATKCLARL